MKKYLYIALISSLVVSCKPKEKIVAKEKKQTVSGETQLTEKQWKDFTFLFYNASKEKMLNNYDLAESMFEQCIQINPRNATCYFEVATINAYQGNNTKALLNAQKAVDFDPDNIWFNLLLADCLTKDKKLNEAAAVYQKLIKKNPDRIDFYYELSSIQLYQGKNDDAIKTFDKIEEKVGVSEEITLRKIRIYKDLKKYDKAIAESKKLIVAMPKEGKYYGMLGEIYQLSGNKEKAFETYQELLKVDPTNPYVHLSLADYYRTLKQDDKSFAELMLAFQNEELDIDTKMSILTSYYELTEKNPEYKTQAYQLCEAAIKAHPTEAKGYSFLGDFYFRDKELIKARDNYRKALEFDKDKYPIWTQVLLIDNDLQDYDSMVNDGKQCLDYFPTQPLPYFICGFGYLQQKKDADAITILRAGLIFVVDDKALKGQFYSNIGDAEHRVKNYTASDSAYEKALELDPANLYVLNNYSYYLSLRKINLDKAEAMSKKTVDAAPTNNSFLDTYGWILYQQKKYADAKTFIGRAIDNGGTKNSVILEHMGDVLYQLGDIEKALQYWIDAQKNGQGSENLGKKVADKKLYE